MWARLASAAQGAAATVTAGVEDIASALQAVDWAAEVGELAEGLAGEAACAAAVVGRVSAAAGGAAAAVATSDAKPSVQSVTAALAGLAAGAGAALAAVAHEIAAADADAGAPLGFAADGAVTVAAPSPRKKGTGAPPPAAPRTFSRLEAELDRVRHDPATYCSEPADGASYAAWRAERAKEAGGGSCAADAALASDPFIAALHARVVIPGIVPAADFWDRYFYRLEGVRARHEARVRAARVVEGEEEEEELGDEDAAAGAGVPVGEPGGAGKVGGSDDDWDAWE